MRYVSTNVDVYLDEFDSDDLIKELEDRGYSVIESSGKIATSDDIDQALAKICDLITSKKSYEKELSDLIYKRIGRVV